MQLENKNNQTKTDEPSKFLTKSKKKPLKIESDREGEFYISIFQNFLAVKNKQLFHDILIKVLQ